jgi:Zn-dependent protease with chaperone function
MLAIANSANAASLVIEADGTVTEIPLAAVTLGERVGTIPRLVQLPGGASLEVLDNTELDAALQAAGVRTAEASIRQLESRWRYALIAVLLTLLGTALFLKFGVPALAARAVRFIPVSVDAYIGEDTLQVLDRSTFHPSLLTPERKVQLRAAFAEVAAGASPDSARYRLEFRRGGPLGANAVALPSGVVVLTDELEHLAHDDDELRGVFAHEVGHLVNRHAMRMLVESSATALLMAGLFGDASGVSSLTTAAPTVLASASYSRGFEHEADAFAARWMSVHQLDPHRLAELLTRLSEQQGGDGGGYLSSHPSLRDRLRAIDLHREPGKSPE